MAERDGYLKVECPLAVRELTHVFIGNGGFYYADRYSHVGYHKREQTTTNLITFLSSFIP